MTGVSHAYLRFGIRSALKQIWWARRDSNPQPSGYEPPALTIELQALPEVSGSRGPMADRGWDWL